VPIEVDAGARRDELARATLALAARHGSAGVTIRAVAERLGGSTTLVTNYVPTRAALLLNAVLYMMRRWEDVRARALEGVADDERLTALARWSCTTTPDDVAFRRLLVELVAQPDPPEGLAPLAADAREHRDDLADAARRADLADPEHAADALFLLLRGFYYISVEQPGRYAPGHVLGVVERLTALLRDGVA
jgi:AcrR family transcriptional regulator